MLSLVREMAKMKNKRIAEIIFRTIYVTLGFIGIIGSLGYFNKSFSSSFYVMYTNLSNYLCIGIILYLLIKCIRGKEEEAKSLSILRFTSVIMILVTFFVYNILLAGEKTASEYFFSISNLIMHVVLPLMFTADWIIFSKHNVAKVYYPLLSTVLPLIYVVFILIRAAILGPSYSGTLYPYFFLNVAKLGYSGVMLWILILVAVFVVLGYILFLADRYKDIKGKIKKAN